MGKPLNKKFFAFAGDTPTSKKKLQLRLTLASYTGGPSNDTNSWIIRQRSPEKYEVTNGTNAEVLRIVNGTGPLLEGTCSLKVSSATNSKLFAVSGDGGSPSETLFILDQSNATPTLVLELGNGGDGEALGFNPFDSLIYHSSGHLGPDVIFEKINSTFTETTNIPIDSGSLINEEAQALTWDPTRGEFLWKQNHGAGPLFSVNSVTSAETLIGAVDHKAKGLAFVGLTLYTVDGSSDLLRTINPFTAATLTSVSITLSSFTVTAATGLATGPDRTLWALLKLSEQTGRELVTLNPTTGVATSIGDTGIKFAGIAFSGQEYVRTFTSHQVKTFQGNTYVWTNLQSGDAALKADHAIFDPAME